MVKQITFEQWSKPTSDTPLNPDWFIDILMIACRNPYIIYIYTVYYWILARMSSTIWPNHSGAPWFAALFFDTRTPASTTFLPRPAALVLLHIVRWALSAPGMTDSVTQDASISTRMFWQYRESQPKPSCATEFYTPWKINMLNPKSRRFGRWFSFSMRWFVGSSS